MDYAAKLATLERLNGLVNDYLASSEDSENAKERQVLFTELCDVYGQVADVYADVVGTKSVEVPLSGGRGVSHYPNFFEAGFLSGRTFHTYQGRSELMTVIGKLRARLQTQSSNQSSASVSNGGNRVFVVHGHNQSVLQTCARFIERLELPVTILGEEPNKGRTIFEKFLDYSDVGFAVVLLTGDDRGGRVDQSYEDQALRARQNVIFELGFFIGQLGRDRVCALYENGVEIPSDYQGVAFVPLDPRQAWRFELAKEMKAAGLPVDLNKAI
jgi:predicted nucleotide-binding protein